jgi:hypothetical protein
MNTNEHAAFIALIADVQAFYGKDLSEFGGNVWWEAMKPYDYRAVADALNRHCVNPDSGQFAPKPADVVKMLQGSTQDSALVAWAKVDRAVRSCGTYNSVVFDDPIIHRVIMDMGGWVQVGGKDEKEWPFVAKEFENRYRGYKMRNETPEYQRVLTGISESQNNRAGHKSHPPVLIGHAEQAKRVMLGGSDNPQLTFTRAGSLDAMLASIPQLAQA